MPKEILSKHFFLFARRGRGSRCLHGGNVHFYFFALCLLERRKKFPRHINLLGSDSHLIWPLDVLNNMIQLIKKVVVASAQPTSQINFINLFDSSIIIAWSLDSENVVCE